MVVAVGLGEAGWVKHIWSCLLSVSATATIGFHSSADCQVKHSSVGSLVNAALTQQGPLSVGSGDGDGGMGGWGGGGVKLPTPPPTTMISATQSIKNASPHQQPKHLKSTKAILILKRGLCIMAKSCIRAAGGSVHVHVFWVEEEEEAAEVVAGVGGISQITLG